MDNKAIWKRTLILKIFGSFKRKSNTFGCKGVIQTQSILKHTNMCMLFISKHQVPQTYNYENYSYKFKNHNYGN